MSKETTPLAKAITTLEGQLVLVSDLVLGAAAGAGALPAKYAAIVGAVQNVAFLVQRGVLKLKASKALDQILLSKDPVKQAIREILQEGVR